MKMKKWMPFLLCGMVVAFPQVVKAEELPMFLDIVEEDEEYIYIQIGQESQNEEELDGNLMIYEVDGLAFDEEKLTASSAIDSYSVNVYEDGSVQLAYLASGEDADYLFQFAYQIVDDNFDYEAFYLEGLLYDAEGQEYDTYASFDNNWGIGNPGGNPMPNPGEGENPDDEEIPGDGENPGNPFAPIMEVVEHAVQAVVQAVTHVVKQIGLFVKSIFKKWF